jgi:hypothetical protein
VTSERDELKWRLWAESWNHSRHLETMRSQYLGFFFTASLAVAAFAAPDVAKGHLSTSASLILLAVLVFGLDLLAGFLILAVARIGEVLGHYQRAQREIQAEVVGDKTPSWLELPQSSPRRRLRSTQGASEGVLQLALVGFPAILLVASVRSFTVDRIPLGTQVIVSVSLVAAAAVSVACFVASRTRA